jgi:tripartite-type tricarboxylate transporter receptor subunit TctC
MAMKQARALNALGLIFSAVFAAATSWCSVVHADDAYPRRPISLVVPWSPGGNADVMARIVAEKLGPELGTTVVIENRPGGNGIVGTDYVAKAKPDGYTLTFYGFSTHVLAGEMFTNVPFNTLRDFEAVSLVSTSPLILMTQPATGYKTINDLVAAAKAAPGKLNYAHFGIGTVSQLAAEEFQKQTGTKMTAVPYTSTKSILTDMIGGTVRIDMFFDSIPSSLPFARSNQLVALGVSSLNPVGAATGIPTVASVLPGFQFGVFAGIGAPKGTPRAIVDKLQKAIANVMKREDVRQRHVALAAEPLSSTPEEFTAMLVEKVKETKELLKGMGIEPRPL